MSEGSRPGVVGVVVAHGGMAQGLVDAVRKIAGVEEHVLVAVSNEGRSPDDLRAELARLTAGGPTVVFTDLQAGSCALTALAVSGSARTLVVCGANLPMLLDFVFHRTLSLEELSSRLVDKGRQGIRSLTAGGGVGVGSAQNRGESG